MKEDFKKWVYETANIDCPAKYDRTPWTLDVLIEAMWAINRNSKWVMRIKEDMIWFWHKESSFPTTKFFKDYNDCEQQALEAALKYIFDNKEK